VSDHGPYTTFTACARDLGVSPDTINRTRKAAGETPKKGDRPWFGTRDELFAWWRDLRARAGLLGGPASSSSPTSRHRPADAGEAFDAAAMRRELLGGGR
jgi:hypothetical protein